LETSGSDSGNVQTHGELTGLHNKPTGYSASGAYAPGREEEEEEEEEKKKKKKKKKMKKKKSMP
jgi:hypothetical protein